jgi:hypothetical protein
VEYYDLIKNIRDGIAKSTAIAEWCDNNFDKLHTVYIEQEDDNPPPKSDYPVIVIMAAGQQRDLDVQYGDMIVQIGFGIEDDSRTRSLETIADVGNVSVYEYGGVETISDFRQSVEDVLFGLVNTGLGGAWVASANEEMEADYPYFRSVVDYVFKNPDRFKPFRIG